MMFILLYGKMRPSANDLSKDAFEDLIRWATINTLYWNEANLYLFESNYHADEIRKEFLDEPHLANALEKLIIFEIPRFKDVASFGLTSEQILRTFMEIDSKPRS